MLAALVALVLTSPPVINPKWEVAFVRGGDIWMSRADGKGLRRIVRNADTPRWSPDGKKLAYAKGLDVWIHDFAGNSDRRVAELPPPKGKDTEKYIEWDPKVPALLCATRDSTAILLIGFEEKVEERVEAEILKGTLTAPTNSMRWSPSGKTLAYAHGGDIWVAERFTGPTNSRIGLIPPLYYDYANRLAPLAVFNDAEYEVSDTPPLWVDALDWTRDERRLVFHFQRAFGASGVSKIGYLELRRTGKARDLLESGYEYTTHWILNQAFSPRVCPDGKTLSFVAEGSETDLFVGSWDGKSRRRVLKDVWDPDWRPR